MAARFGTIKDKSSRNGKCSRVVLRQEGSRMKLQCAFRVGMAGCLLTLAWWFCAPLRAEQSAPEPEAAAATFAKGPLPQHVAEQVRAIVLAQAKAFFPPPEEGAVEIDRVGKDAILTATVNGQKYSGKVFRSFLVQPRNPDEFEAMQEFYVRTTAPWPLKAGLVIPADIYLSGMADHVNAFDAETITAQDAAISRSDALCKRALDQLEPERKAKAAEISAAHKGELDSLAKQIKQQQDEIEKKLKDREEHKAWITRRQPPPTTPIIIPGPNNTFLWKWVPGEGFTFNDGLDQSREKLDETFAAQKARQATIEAEQSAATRQTDAKARAVRAVFQKQSRSIRAGETNSDEDMRTDYESALGEPLKETAAPVKPESPRPGGGKPPIQAVPAPPAGKPAPKQGT
jgi:hypothetical protein